MGKGLRLDKKTKQSKRKRQEYGTRASINFRIGTLTGRNVSQGPGKNAKTKMKSAVISKKMKRKTDWRKQKQGILEFYVNKTTVLGLPIVNIFYSAD